MGCDREEVGDGALGIRVGALFAMLLVTWVTPLIPLRFQADENSMAPFLIKAFGAGIVLATAFVHILPEAAEAFEDECLGAPDFPFAFVIAAFACVVTFALEHSLVTVIHRKSVERMSAPILLERGSSFRRDSCADPERSKSVAAASSLVLEAGLIFHSLFIGIDLGVQDKPSDALGLAVALMVHQAFEGLALGSVLVSANTPWKTHLKYATAFALTTPIGIAIGIGIASSSSPNSPANLLVQGIFDSISGGILMTVALLDLLHPTFESVPSRPHALGYGLLAVALGVGAMSVLALWA